MSKYMIMVNGIIFFYILQRISEMLLSRGNEKWLKKHCGAVEVDPKESVRMKIFHTLWFVSLIVEANIKKEFHPDIISLIIYIILGGCLAVRFYSMEKLKRFWTIKIFSMDNQVVVTDGLYKYLRHPNYLIVIIELFFLPLLFKAYYTMFIFSFLNIFVLLNRIKLEEEALMKNSNYHEKFLNVKKLFPFFSLFLFLGGVSNSSLLSAAEVNYQYKNYAEAKLAKNYIKFEGTSTKLGFITTGFDGFAKEIKINYELDGIILKSLDVLIPTKSLDTNITSRDEKMINVILENEKFPDIHAKILDKVTLSNGEQFINMLFTVKDKQVTKPVKFSVVKKDNKFLITGETTLGLKELALPDPSIVVAKVRDNFDLKFSVLL